MGIAGEVRLKSGFTIEGNPVPQQGLTKALAEQSSGPITVYPILMVDNGRQRIFVPNRQIVEISEAADLSKYVKFKMPQKLSGRKMMVASLGDVLATPFDEFGRRSITLATSRGNLTIIQGITELNPKYVKVTGLNYTWEHALATTSIPPNILDTVLRNKEVTNQSDSDDRLSIALFYVQAELYLKAGEELDSINRDFPDQKQRVKEMTVQLQQLQARQLLGELRRRKAAGQTQLAYEAAKAFPIDGLGAEVRREVSDLIVAYEQDRDRKRQVIDLLDELQGKLADLKQRTAFAPIRTAITEGLDDHSLARLDSFLKLSTDNTLSAAEKLALAASGWVVGSANAGTDFDAAIRLWTARHLVVGFLRTEDVASRVVLLDELKRLEGFSPKTLTQMVPQLPPPVETQGIVPGKACRVEVAGGKDGSPVAAYHVLLPQEYSPNRAYPLLIVLHRAGRPPQDDADPDTVITPAEYELRWWGLTRNNKPGQSQRHGYIVVAPEWADPKMREYDYGVQAHQAVQLAIRDASLRFHVDADRVFLAGRQAGGDAAFDIGMSHPDLFAGVIPFTGVSDRYCKWYWQNAKHTAWYVVTGELDRDSMARNARDMNRMLRYGYDLIYAEYAGRGAEWYFEEVPRLFEWMALHRRAAEPKEIDVNVLRPTDTRFFWLEAHGLPASVSQSAVLADDGSGKSPPVRPMSLVGKSTETNSVYITSGSATHTLRLTANMVDFEKRFAVRHNGRQKFNDFLQPSLAVMLDDLRQRGDRQRVYQSRIEWNEADKQYVQAR